MSLTVEDVERWDPGAVRAVGDAARTRAQTSIDTANSLPTFPDWTGPGSEEAKQALDKTRRALMRDADAALAAARSADAAAVNVQIVKDNLQQVLNMARDCGMVVDPVAGTVCPALPSVALPNDWHNAEVLQHAIQQVLAQANTVDQQLAAAMDRADDVVDVPPEARPIPLPPPGASTEDVEQWWKSLSQKDRERLIAEHPAESGNLNGIPAAARDTINQQVQTDDLNRIADTATQHGVSKEQVLANPGFYGLSADDVTRYNNALKVQQGMNHQRGDDPDPSRQRPVMLWKYEPLADNGQGRAAIAIGNPDYADNTTVIVPGTGSSVEGGWLSDGHNDAMNLWDQANAADPNSTHSVMSWMGYDAPDGFSDTRVANPDLARAGGDVLAADVNGLWTTHQDAQQHVTVIGHSYGSTTVADVRRLRYARQRCCPHRLSGNGFGQERRRFPPRRRQRLRRLGVDGPGQLHRNDAGVSARLSEPQTGLSDRARRGPRTGCRGRPVRLDQVRRGGGRARRPRHERPFALLRHGQRVPACHDLYRHRRGR